MLSFIMTRTATFATITSKLASFDDERLAVVADIVQALDSADALVRPLSPRERALVERSKQDFAEGYSLSHYEVVELLDERLAARGMPKSTS
jgi:hypothetical protein